MSQYKSLVGCILLALSVVNASPVHLDIKEASIARVQRMKRNKALYNNHLGKRDGTVIAVPIPPAYTTTIYTDDGSTEYDVAVDTGSPVTWIGADPKNPYVKGRSSQPTGKTFKLHYADGPFVGMEYIDSIMLETTESSDPLIIDNQSIGVATLVTNFPRLLDVVDNLYRQGSIKYASFGIYFTPQNDKVVGEITFGYCNEAVITSGLTYVPITNVPPASNYWGVDGYFMYGGRTILNPASGVIDTGNNAITIPKDAILAYQSATGATMSSDGWLIITQEQYDGLETLTIFIGGQSYDLSPNAQIQPRRLPSSPIRLVVLENPAVEIDFALGHPFVQRYYVLFNETSSQIGFASTHNTGSTTN
ncbi:hypothetical protein ID866_8534 [Astraeus odoratus]|nr:hypothetical protein ID866_8534 [Astraeus odoratus]